MDATVPALEGRRVGTLGRVAAPSSGAEGLCARARSPPADTRNKRLRTAGNKYKPWLATCFLQGPRKQHALLSCGSESARFVVLSQVLREFKKV